MTTASATPATGGARRRTIVPIAAFHDNYIWALRCGDHAMVIDPGDATPVAHWLAQQGLPLRAIWVTHQHSDHIGGVARLQAQYGCTVYAPSCAAIANNIPNFIAVQDQQSFVLEGGTMQVLHTPGHTGEHVSYVHSPPAAEQAPALFCGDTLFVLGCGRVFPQLGGSVSQLYASLNKIKQLPPRSRVYCAHEYTLQNIKFCLSLTPALALSAKWRALLARLHSRRAQGLPTVPSTLAQELQFNPFLRCSSLEQFTDLRKRKDCF